MKKHRTGIADAMPDRYMKHVGVILTALLGCCLLLCMPLPAQAKDYGKDDYDRTRWGGIREDYLNTKTDRLIFVKYRGGTRAVVEMWEKAELMNRPLSDEAGEEVSGMPADGTDAVTDWIKIVSCDAYVGANGLDKKKEGDRKTPTGIYNITMAFGRKQSPGTAGISYTKLNKYHYRSDERDTYNQFVDVRTLNRKRMSGEHLIDYDPQYNYALALDYNKKCIYLKGSAIFLHCFGNHTYTEGCIAVSEKDMKKILRNTTTHTKICIYRQ